MTEADRPEFLGRRVPDEFEVRRISIAAGAERRSTPREWRGSIVVLERGAVELVSAAGARRSFGAGDMICPDWVDCERIVNIGAEEARLVAIDRPLRLSH
jgi:hypothetical protein